MCWASDNHNYMCHTCEKNFKIRASIKHLLPNITFSRYCPKFHTFTNILFFQVYLQLSRPTASSLSILCRDMSGILFFIFASCEPLRILQRAIRLEQVFTDHRSIVLILKLNAFYYFLLFNLHPLAQIRACL